VIDGSEIATCQMYETNQALISGYSKSLWNAFGGVMGSLVVNGIFLFIYVFPLAGFFTGHEVLASLSLLFGTSGRLISAQTTKSRLVPDSLLHPLSVLAFTFLNIVSWRRHLTRTNTWKSRDLR
jgi:hypothetical protein